MSTPAFCAHCGAPRTGAARFCHRCGAAHGGVAPAGSGPAAGAGAADGRHAPGVRGTANGGASLLPWAIAAIAVLSFVAFVAGQRFARSGGSGPNPGAVAAAPGGPIGGTPGRAPDISQMSPDERADRLFQRVMTLVAQGQSDSVRFFAPMAIQAMEALAPLDAHRRYDLGLLGVVNGDGAMARAQADTILAAQPTHLLGLILAMRAAGLQLDTLARRGFADRLLAALPRERAKGLQEYVDHGPDIEAAAREASSGPSLPPPR